MDEWRALPNEERLTYLVGLVVRSAVDLDAMSRTVYATLAGAEPSMVFDAPANLQDRTGRAVAFVRATSALDEEARASASAALEAAYETYRTRNRFVHDDLMPSGEPGATWWSMNGLHRAKGHARPEQSRIELSDVEQCQRDLVRATWRMWGLHKLIQVMRSPHEPHVRRRWLLLVTGDFKLHPDDTISYSH